MSQNPVDPPVADTPTPSVNLAEYEDLSGAPLSRSASIRTQTRAEGEIETEDEDEPEPEPEPEPEKQVKDNSYDGLGLASAIVFSGMMLAAVAYFVNQPLRMEHPHSMHDYF
jgi:hypothetical protein